MKFENNKSVQTTFWAFAEKIGYTGVQFVISVILARLLSPDDYGVVALLLVFITLGQVFVDSGFGNGLIRKEKCSNDDYSTAFYFNLLVSLLIYSILYIAAPFISEFYNLPILVPVIRVYGVCLIINSLTIVQNSVLTRSLNFKAMALYRIVSGTLSGIIAIILAYFDFGVWSLVSQTLLMSFIYLLLANYETRWVPSFIFNKDSFRYLWGFGSKMLLSGLISSLYSNMYSLVIGKVYSKGDLGYFNRGHSLGTLLPGLLQTSFGKSTFPLLAQNQNDMEKLKELYRSYTRVVALISFPIVIIIALLAHPLILFLLSEKWNGAVFYMQVFSISSILLPVGIINMNLLMALGRSDMMLKADIIKKTIGISVILLLASYGVKILALGSMGMDIFIYVVNLYFVKKVMNFSYFSQIKDMGPYLIASIVMGLGVYLFVSIIPVLLCKLVLGFVIGIAIYILILKLVLKDQYVSKLFACVLDMKNRITTR